MCPIIGKLEVEYLECLLGSIQCGVPVSVYSMLLNHPRDHLRFAGRKGTALLGARCVCDMLEGFCCQLFFLKPGIYCYNLNCCVHEQFSVDVRTRIER